MIAQLAACGAAGGDQRPGSDCCGTLNIVVERANLIAVAVEQRHRVFLREILELEQHVRPAMFNRLDEIIDELVILVVRHARVTPTHIQRVGQQLLVVRTDIEHNRQRVRRADTPACGVQREFTDRNTHPADTLIAETQNTFAIRHHNHFDVVVRHVLQNVIHVVAILVRDKHAARATINLGETLTRRTDGGGVDHRHHLFEMILHQPIEEGFISILNVS
ncbi:hypothetical protein D3C78_678570 [compost metagenome]